MAGTARAHAFGTSGPHVAAAIGAVAAARELVAAAVMAMRSLVASLPAAVPRPEAILPAARLPDGELRDRTLRRLLAVGTRQRCANQAAMDRTFVVLRLLLLLLLMLFAFGI